MKKFITLISACLMTATIACADSGNDPMTSDTSFNTLDTDQDGQINQEEARMDPKLEEQFANIDLDADGTLSSQEYSVYAGGAPAAGEAPLTSDPIDAVTPDSEN